jgi:hypothetical protein
MPPAATAPRPWRTAFFVILALYTITVAVAAYLLLDAGITLTYRDDQARYDRQDMVTLTKLGPALIRGSTQRDVLSLLREQDSAALISSAPGRIEVGGLLFEFGPDGHLARIRQGPDRLPTGPAEP